MMESLEPQYIYIIYMNYCLDMTFNIMNRSHIFYHMFLSSSDSLILFLNTKNLYLTRLPVRCNQLVLIVPSLKEKNKLTKDKTKITLISLTVVQQYSHDRDLLMFDSQSKIADRRRG